MNMTYLKSVGVVDPRAGSADSLHSAYCGRFDGSESKHASPAMAAAANGGSAEEDPSSLPTSTKWSVLSSRVEGLVAELSQVVGKVDAYCVSQSKCEGPAMRAVREKMLRTPWGEEWDQKRTMFSYGEEMSTDPLEAMLLKQLVFMAAPRRVLEIGMFVGYGSVAMLEGSPAARVVSLEIDPYLKTWLSSCLSSYPEMAERHEVVIGPALDSLPHLTGEFDMVFVDANKAEYRRYVEIILERKLLSATGVIVCDNILYNGYPYMNNHFDAQPARRGFGDAIREFNQWVCDHPELEQIVLPVRDGMSIIRHAAPAHAAPTGNGFAPPPREAASLDKARATPAAGPPLSRPSFDVSGANFIVTGGTQGLGLEIARQLKACGASSLALLARTRAKGEKVVAEMSGAGCVVHFVEADMSDPASLQAAATEAIRLMGGRVDGLVNAAGTTERGNLLETTVEMYNKQFDINTRGPFFLTQAGARRNCEHQLDRAHHEQRRRARPARHPRERHQHGLDAHGQRERPHGRQGRPGLAERRRARLAPEEGHAARGRGVLYVLLDQPGRANGDGEYLRLAPRHGPGNAFAQDGGRHRQVTRLDEWHF